MCVLSYRAQSRWWYLKKKCFFEISLNRTAQKIAANQAESFDFPAIYQKIRNEKAQRSTILEGGFIRTPLRI